jgi:uncharacterized protein (DUF58 family)
MRRGRKHPCGCAASPANPSNFLTAASGVTLAKDPDTIVPGTMTKSPQPEVEGWSLSHFLPTQISEVWLRFLLAITGLGFAFAAALFSTVSRESGDMWATLILASAALILAAIVALTTVPYLLRRVAIAHVRDAFDYDVTKTGIVYVLVSVLIGIAALNTGNNLLYIVVAAMLAAMLVSGVASATNLKELELDVRLPVHVFAGRSVSGRIVLKNRRRWLPSFSVTVVPPKKRKARREWRLEHATFAFPAGRSPDRQWIHIPDRSLRLVRGATQAAGIFHGSVYFPYIPAREDLSADVALSFERRGRYQQDHFGLATRFPFAFLTKTRRVPLARQVTVYPPVEPPEEFFEVLPLITGEFESFVRGRGYDLYRIREYMPEDSARHVDWKATAKSGSPKVREFTREDERKLRIVFDNPAPGVVKPTTYENAVNLAASLAWHFSHENTDISFVAQGYDGNPDLYAFLAHLAVVEPRAGESVIEKLRITNDYNIILTTRPRRSFSTAIWTSSYVLFIEDRV